MELIKDLRSKYSIMEVKFNQGDEVYERIRPGQKLIITRYSGGVYYCKAVENPGRKELIYFERELMTRKLPLGPTE